ncbi:hypothetical protein FLP10_09380 [Agromyces intestinalis]|uniref:SH3 domain-containing protein n=1 Tax=Agromyces intestinalis TaxID=2592652 RepID=A0A5C1YGF0_9MICO|nr:hypothetical protein [Agromyces intestinalis]QEO14605.1 hypothetical protein FLP10_09380 [Agromyces intestinalis]
MGAMDRRSRTVTSRVVAVCIALAATASLAGCASPGQQRLERAIEEQVAAAADGAGFVSQSPGLNAPADAIGAYARNIQDELIGTGVQPKGDSGWIPGSPDHAEPLRLVAIEPNDDASRDDPVGALVLASRLTVVSDHDRPPYDHCVRVEFDRWGWIEGSVRGTACPDPLTEIVPPPDLRPIVPDSAEAVAIAVLASAADASADELAATIAAQLPPEPDGPPVAEVRVLREGDRVGLAMGDARDCLLVRAEDGAAERVHVQKIQLQPGELGCRPETALLREFPKTH